jgi:hypothetical protein
VIPTETWVLPRPRTDCYVGSFPLHFEKKLWRLLGRPQKVLHPFGGLAGLEIEDAARRDGVDVQVDTIDLNPTTTPTWTADAHDLSFIADDTYDLTLLDPPYSDDESAWLYSTPPLKPGQYTREAVRVTKSGGLIAIYHVRQPPRPAGTRLIRRIVVLTRTGHKARICFVFQKDAE